MGIADRTKKVTACVAACVLLELGLAGCATAPKFPVSADDAISAVTTIAAVYADGPRVKAIVVKYDSAIDAGAVSKDTYEVFSYVNLPIVYDVAKSNGGPKTGAAADQPYTAYPTFERKKGTPGAAIAVYVSSKPTIDPDGKGDASGDYVIIELNTDYLLTAKVPGWRSGVAGGVKQVKSIVLADGTHVTPGTKVEGNYEKGHHYDISPFGDSHSATYDKVFDDSLYTLDDLDGYKIYTDNVGKAHTGRAYNGKTVRYPNATILSKVAGPAFKATRAYSEYDGKHHDVSLMYSLFVPSEYDSSKKYMLVLMMEDAGALGDDPVDALTESQGPANFASDRVQQLAKDHGYGGVIVVVPQIPKGQRSMDDNLTGNQYLPATWQLMDMITSKYNIDINRIYGCGQSMGGMQLLDMAAQRDNYFAGIWSIGSQWGNNYNKSATYQGKSFSTYPFDGKIITNPDWQNWYYSVSDDNILETNMVGDERSTGYWNEMKQLYKSLGGATISYAEWTPQTVSIADQDAKLKSLVSRPSSLGIYWSAMTGGEHTMTWIYAHQLSEGYDWLLSQTRQSEQQRGKLDLNGSYASGRGTKGYNSVLR